MRLLLITILCLCSLQGIGQIELEHTYESSRPRRLKLPQLGEVYTSYKSTEHIMKIYNANHQLIKQIPLPATPNSKRAYIHVSQHIFNADDKIEILYHFWDDDADTSASILINEDEKIIKEYPNTYAQLSIVEGLAPKLIISGKDIYSLPDFELEHQYQIGGPLRREKFKYLGEVYYYINNPDRHIFNVHIFNAQHELIKTIEFATPQNKVNYSYARVHISQGLINDDDKIEIGYVYSDYVYAGKFMGVIINEDGQVLKQIEDAYSFSISEIEGLPNKLHVRTHISIDNGPEGTKIYSLPDLEFEHYYPQYFYYRKNLPQLGEIYYGSYSSSRYEGEDFYIYDHQHQLIKTVPIPKLIKDDFRGIRHVSQHQLFPDDKLEIAYYYSVYDSTTSSYSFNTRLVDEDGNELYEFVSSSFLDVDQTADLTPKVIVDYMGGRRIYAINHIKTDLLPHSLVNLTIYPNPAENSLTIDSEFPLLSVQLRSLIGQEIPVNYDAITRQLDIQHLTKGIYFLQVETAKGIVLKKFYKN